MTTDAIRALPRWPGPTGCGYDSPGAIAPGGPMARPTKTTREPAERAAPDTISWRDFDPSWLPGGERNALAREFATYRDRLDDLLEHKGQFVVIKGDRVLGFYRDQKKGLAAALEAFGAVPVLVKRVVETEPIRRPGNVIL
jgi:hypothetical protein